MIAFCGAGDEGGFVKKKKNLWHHGVRCCLVLISFFFEDPIKSVDECMYFVMKLDIGACLSRCFTSQSCTMI